MSMMFCLWAVIALISVVVAEERVMEKYRVPQGIKPEHYKLKILTDLANDFSFLGEVWIDIIPKTRTSSIVLNHKNLNIFENETRVEMLPMKVKRSYKTNKYRRLSMERKAKEDEAAKETMPAASSESAPTPVPAEETPTISATIMQNTSPSPEYELSTSEKVPAAPTSSESPQETTQTPKTPSEELTTVELIELSTERVTYPDIIETTATTDESTVSLASTTEEIELEEYLIDDHDFDSDRQFLTLKTNKELVPNARYRVYLKYQGFLNDNLVGFHRVAYTKKNKRTSWLASTVFEPIEARSAFPCMDEPEYKATFEIILGHSSEYHALSNMPLRNTEIMDDKSGWQWDHFQTTPPMSTYLVAFLISDLESLDTKQTGRNATEFRYWARHDVVHKARYASKIVPSMKAYLDNLFGVTDTMPKYDLVALPSFISNALENWGLIAFSEKALLFSPGWSAILSKYETTRLLGHELSHTWFGNSLTPRYWNHIWISEGLCNFFETKAADHVQPQWDVLTFSAVSSYLRVFSLDSLHSTHPLVPELKDLNDINEIFDSITYQKGYYIMRMLNHTLGEDAFMKGIRAYVNNNRFKVIEESDLWKELTSSGHESATLPKDMDLQEVMRSWTTEPGYPVIQVTRNYGNRSAVITQKRFLRPKEDYELRSPNGSDSQLWYIPVTYTSGSEMRFRETSPRFWMLPKQEEYRLDNVAEDNDFLLFNIQGVGMYRVNYDYDNWALLVDQLLSENYTKISVMNRVQILDDLLDFARAGEISYQQALDAMTYLRQEVHYLPWKSALTNFEYISRMLRSTDSGRVFKKFMRGLVSARYDELGFDEKKNETLFESMNRKQIVKWACRTGHRQCTRKSLNLFKKWTEEKKPDENNPIPSNLRSVVYCTAIEQGGARDWQFLWQRYLSNTVTDKAAIIAGLGCSRNARTLRKYLDWSLKESSGVKKQDSVAVFKAVAGNDVGFPLAKKFLKERLNEVPKYVGASGQHLPQLIDALARKMNQIKDLEDLEEIEHENSSIMRNIPRSVRQAMEKVKFNIGWLQKNLGPINEWLKLHANA